MKEGPASARKPARRNTYVYVAASPDARPSTCSANGAAASFSVNAPCLTPPFMYYVRFKKEAFFHYLNIFSPDPAGRILRGSIGEKGREGRVAHFSSPSLLISAKCTISQRWASHLSG